MVNDLCPTNDTMFKEVPFGSGSWMEVDLCQNALNEDIEAKERVPPRNPNFFDITISADGITDNY